MSGGCCMRIRVLLSLSVLAVLFTATVSFGQVADVCTINPLTSPDVDSTHPATKFAIIGVASNFWGPHPELPNPPIPTSPALSMVNNFLTNTTAPVTSTAITICHNATSTLKANYNKYDFLFLADGTAGSVGSFPFSYARGVPVVFGYDKDISDVSQLIIAPGGISGPSAEISGLISNSYSVAGNTQYLALADPSLAPYGLATQKILTPMSTGYPPLTAYPTLFPNIGLTFEKVGTNPGQGYVTSGFVSKGQICTLQNIVTFVEFTNNEYTLDQTASVIHTSNLTAMGMYSWIQIQRTGPYWNAFLAGFCYGGV